MSKKRSNGTEKKHPYLRPGFKFDCDKVKDEKFTIDKR